MVAHVLTVWVPTCADVRPGTRVPAVKMRLTSVPLGRVSTAQHATTMSTRLFVSACAASVDFIVRLMTTTARQGSILCELKDVNIHK